MRAGDDKAGKFGVFISYSRVDLDFSDQLQAALETCGFSATLDRHGISGGEAWKARLATLIRGADTVVFVLSPSSAKSEVCAWEVEEAVQLGKRIIPVLCRPLQAANPPQRLRELNYICFYDDPNSPGSGFGTGLRKLVSALNTDLSWLREHTRLLQRATEWAAKDRSPNWLLFGESIREAKDWTAGRPKDATEPTALHLEYIRASEEWATLQQSEERKRLQEIAAAQADRGRALAEAEQAVKDKATAQQREAEASRRVVRRTLAGLVASLMLAALASCAYVDARSARARAEREAKQARIAQQAEEAAKFELKARVDELTAANIRLTPSVKLRIARSVPGAKGPQVIDEDWYKIATDGTRAIVVLRVPARPELQPFIGTGFILKGEALSEKWHGETILVTAYHVAWMAQRGSEIVPSALSGTLPGLPDNAEVAFDKVLLASRELDIAVLRVSTKLPFGAIPLERVTELETAMQFAPSSTDAALPSVILLSYLGSGETGQAGFQFGVSQVLPTDRRPSSADAGAMTQATVLQYAYVTGGGASGAPVFDANTGEVLCVHQLGVPRDSPDKPAHGGCAWLGAVRSLMQERGAQE